MEYRHLTSPGLNPSNPEVNSFLSGIVSMAVEGKWFPSFIFCISEDPLLKQLFSLSPHPPLSPYFFCHRMDSQSSDLSALPLNLAPASSAWAGGHSGILLATLLLTNANVMFAVSTTSWQSVFSPLNLSSAHLFMPLMMDHHLAWFSLYSCVLFLPSLGLQTCPQGVIPYFFLLDHFFFLSNLSCSLWIAFLLFWELAALPTLVCSEHLILIFFISLALTIMLNRTGQGQTPGELTQHRFPFCLLITLPLQSA